MSSDTEISGDEEDGNNDSYDDSFIDDRINLTGACTQTESGGIDMMAVYRCPVYLSPSSLSLPLMEYESLVLHVVRNDICSM